MSLALWLFVAAVNASAAASGSGGPTTFIKRAQALLDDIVGRDRLPGFADRPKLVYIDAVVSELLRWRPIAPGAIPRRADKADTLGDAKWAKGAVVFPNAWAIGRDKNAFTSVGPEAQAADLSTFAP